MKTLGRTETYNSTPEKVFQCVDDLGITGMHMTRSSMPMMGGKLHLEFLTPHRTGPGSKYKWTGNVMWFNRVICFLLGDWYCRWCLKHMLGDCKKTVEGIEGSLQHAETHN